MSPNDQRPRPAKQLPAATSDRASIGVLGGTFDPIHHGHLRIALDASESLGLEQVRLIPLAQAVHREPPQASAKHRWAMLKAALAGRVDLVADDRELRRAGPSYTIDTLRSLRDDFPDRSLCLLLGDDAFAGFPAWREPSAILASANLAVLQRPRQATQATQATPELDQLLQAHGTEQLDLGRTGQIVLCPVTQLDIASSDVRRRIANGQSADFLTPRGVIEWIEQHRLYRS